MKKKLIIVKKINTKHYNGITDGEGGGRVEERWDLLLIDQPSPLCPKLTDRARISGSYKRSGALGLDLTLAPALTWEGRCQSYSNKKTSSTAYNKKKAESWLQSTGFMIITIIRISRLWYSCKIYCSFMKTCTFDSTYNLYKKYNWKLRSINTFETSRNRIIIKIYISFLKEYRLNSILVLYVLQISRV